MMMDNFREGTSDSRTLSKKYHILKIF